MDTSPDVDCEVDGPAFEPEGLDAFDGFAAPPPMAFDATALTSGAVTWATKPEGFAVEAFGGMF